MRKSTNWDGCEPAWDEVLDDPVVHAVMRRDGIARGELLDLMTTMRDRLEIARGSAVDCGCAG